MVAPEVPLRRRMARKVGDLMAKLREILKRQSGGDEGLVNDTHPP
jgi:hypothetical protein